ncbi:hypothetical protein PCL_01276 [Purpureocillium lilacinum]|uniref:Uncharacterized protein n=1 Tax=Purpureocillium lilacinum TaxID=33203 RepID=A0A2U3E301_PURLI|nr:hypothetical protein PCL_01276 [Purpureocillium lilacinum]
MRHGRAPALSRSPARTLRHPPSLSLSRWPARSPGLNLSCYCAALPRANRAPRTRDDTGYPRASGSRTRAAREPPIRPSGAPRKDPRAGRRGVGGGRAALPDLSLTFCAVRREMPGTAGGMEMWLRFGVITCQVSPANPSCWPPPINAPGGSCHVRQCCPGRLAGCLAGDPPQTPDGCLSGGAGAGGACAFHAIHGCSPSPWAANLGMCWATRPGAHSSAQTPGARAKRARPGPQLRRRRRTTPATVAAPPHTAVCLPQTSLAPPEVGPLLATAAQLYFLCSPPSRLINLLLLLLLSLPHHLVVTAIARPTQCLRLRKASSLVAATDTERQPPPAVYLR